MKNIDISILEKNAFDKELIAQVNNNEEETNDSLEVIRSYVARNYLPSWANSDKDVDKEIGKENQKLEHYKILKQYKILKN